MLDPKIMKQAVADINTTLDGFSSLHYAASECQVEIVKELLSRPDINLSQLNNMQRTPLHIAAQRGSLEICRLLCGFEKVDVNAKDIDENTPLHLSSKLGHIMCVIYLVKEANCDFTLKNKDGFLAADLAFNMEVRDIFTKLFQASNMPASK